MQATWHGTVIAESGDTIEKHGYTYFPRHSVRMDLLTMAAKSESDLECPHGVQFYDVAVKGKRAERAAWSYEKPKKSMQKVDHWVSFWDEVTTK